MNKIHPSIIAQRTVSMVTGKAQPTAQRYSAIDPSTVRRPVGIGSPHVARLAVIAQQKRVQTTVSVYGGLVMDDDGLRTKSKTFARRTEILSGGFDRILKGDF